MKKSRIAAAVAATLAMPLALADNFTTDSGLEGRWSLNASYGTSVRAKDADKMLVSMPNGGKAGNGNDDGELNFAKGDAFSQVGKLSGELQLKKDNLGAFVRAFAWYDAATKNGGKDHGHYNNGYVAGAKLNDDGFDKLSTFSGVALADAYVFGDFDVAGKPLNVKLGNQVVNWGESLFIPGVNAMGAFDLTAARRPGAQVKEILRPQPQLLANLGFGNGASVEAFYQFGWKRTVLDGCGTYWSMADSLNCGNQGTVVFGDAVGNDAVQFNGAPLLGKLPAALAPLLAANGLSHASPINFRLGMKPQIEPKKSGQFGVSGHYFADSISTDFGAYFAQYHTHTPVISVVKSGSALPSAFSGAIEKLVKAVPSLAAPLGVLGKIPPAQIVWDYSAENIKTAGVSASTEAGGFSLFGELSHTKDIPAQINAPDMLVGAALGVGPQGALASWIRNPAIPEGTVSAGYGRLDKTQLQASFIRVLPQVAGADSLTVLGEVAVQKWGSVGDPSTGTRYGRNFVFNIGPMAALGNSCGTLNAQSEYCNNEGYATRMAWGYRLQAELLYPNVFAGVNLKPRAFLAHDVKGYSADGVFVENRQTRSIGIRADYNNRYYADISFTGFNKRAKYDVLHDRDYYSMVVGVNF